MSVVLQGRNERKKKFLDRDVDLLDIDQAMAAVLEVAEPEFKENVELYGAVHVDELRYWISGPFYGFDLCVKF